MKFHFNILLILSIFSQNISFGAELIMIQYRSLDQKELIKNVLKKNFSFPESVFNYQMLNQLEACPKKALAILDLCENSQKQIEIKSIDQDLLKKFYGEMRIN